MQTITRAQLRDFIEFIFATEEIDSVTNVMVARIFDYFDKLAGDTDHKLKLLADLLSALSGSGGNIDNYLWMHIDSEGDNFMAFGETKTITCRVQRGWDDVTDQVKRWTVTRDTGDATEDAAWNLRPKAKSFNGSIRLSFTAADNDLSQDPASNTLFTFTAEFDGLPTATASLTI